MRKRGTWIVVIAGAVVAASCGEPSGVPRRATIAPGLVSALSAAAPTDTQFVIVQFDDAVTSGATPDNVDCFASALRQRIEQLQRVSTEVPQ